MSSPKVTTRVKDNAGGAGQASAQDLVAVIGPANGASALIGTVDDDGTAPPEMTVTGTPIVDATIVVDVETGATTFRWSKDHGQSWEEEGVDIPTDAPYALDGTGVSIQFEDEAFTADNIYTVAIHAIEVTLYSQPSAVVDDYTSGTAVESVADILSQDSELGKVPSVYLVALPPSVAGANGAVKTTGTSPAPTPSGAPNDDHRVVIEYLKTGARGVATFRWSLDNGVNFSNEILTAASYTIPGSGVIVGFAVGAYVKGNTAKWNTTAPSISNTDLANGFDALKRRGKRVKIVVLPAVASGSNGAARAAAALAQAAAVKVKLDELSTARQQTHVMMQVGACSDAEFADASDDFADRRITICATYVEMVSAVTNRQMRRPLVIAAGSQQAIVPISVDTASIAEAGTLRVVGIERDEFNRPGLDDLRALTARTWPQVTGIYTNEPRTMAAFGSDFEFIPESLVMNEANDVLYRELVRLCSTRLRVNKATGKLTPGQANAIDTSVENALRKALVPEHASDVAFRVIRSDNLLAPGPKILRYTLRIWGHFRAKEIEGDSSFADTALDKALAA